VPSANRSLASCLACVLTMSLAAACGASSSDTTGGTSGSPAGSTTGTTGGGSSSGGSSGATTGGTTAGQAPIILAERIFSPDNRLYYVSVLNEMPTAPIDLSQAREFTSADVEVYMGKVFIRDRVANTMTRFSVDSTNSLVQEAQFSFQAAGLPSGRVYDAYLTPTLAYALDGTDLQMVGWDPTNMTLLPGSVVDLSFLTSISPLPDIELGIPTQVGNQIIIPVTWEDEDNLVISPSMQAMLVLPANASATPAVTQQTGIGGAYVAWGFNGDAYVGGIVGGVQLFGSVYPDAGPIPSSGIARINAGTSTFDPSYAVDVNKIAGSTGVWAVHMLDSNDVLAQILDPSVPTSSFSTPDDIYDSNNYYFVMINVDAGTVVKQTQIPEGGIANSQEHIVDNVLYVQVAEDGGNTAIYPATAAGVGPRQFEVESGDLWFAQRLQ
jgi:hypothetical protein